MVGEIDFVIPWVDDSDKIWIDEKNKYLMKTQTEEQKAMTAEKAYRDWDILRYWFRSIEKYAPWVRYVHLVTYGHIPVWLNLSHPKLKVVRHDDFINKNYLPTFNSRSIEINFHRIPDLSEKFVYFNDDMFLNNDVSENDFFRNDLPVDIGVLSPIVPLKFGTANIQVNNMEIINKHFSFSKKKKENLMKYINVRYGKDIIRSLVLLNASNYCGFLEPHLPNPFLKSTFSKVWRLEPEILEKTASNKFKNKYDVNQWLFRYWQLADGVFYPRKRNFGKYFEITDDNLNLISREILEMNYQMICLNDSFNLKDFHSAKSHLINIVEMKFPEKSSFEL